MLLLNKEKEIAVDLEHHSARTYLGITCLMQLSTRSEDFIIDPISLRDHMHKMRCVFDNPNILKVFHGSDYDIQWL
jgi:exosome complex exonuclease RRP6